MTARGDDPWALLAKTDRPDLEQTFWQRLAQQREHNPKALLQDPVAVAATFLHRLAASGDESQLRALVELATIDTWGDFTDARALLAALGDWAFSTAAAPGPTPDLAYVHLLADVRESFVSDDDQVVFAATTVTLQRREGEWWRVLAFGAIAD